MAAVRTTMTIGLLFLSTLPALTVLALLAGCAVPSPPGLARAGQGESDPGPFPVRFRDMVVEHTFEAYPGDQVLRNIVVHPPVFDVIRFEDVELAGYVGQARFRLKDQEQQAYLPVVYCYFISQETILLFEDKQTAAWCVKGKDD